MTIETAGPARVLAAALMTMMSAGCAVTPGDAAPDEGIVLTTVPTAPSYISGGDALVRIDALTAIDLTGLTITLNGVEVTSDFQPAPPDRLERPEHALLGYLAGMAVGENRLRAMIDGEAVAELTITNYPVTGPIFSGDHLEPYFCLDAAGRARPDSPRRFAIGNGDFIEGSPADEFCAYPTRVDYVYRSGGDDPEFRPLVDPGSVPSDAERIATVGGASIPFIVRLETGTINRAIYQTAVVVDPANPNPDPWNPPAGWNGRLVYTFGGGCEAGFFQGTSTGGVLRADMLEAGYAVASSTLNVNAQGGCNDPLSAETAMMVKERFAEVYGPPVHTIGSGGSGGAMQQYLIAGAYPGILDGILPSLSFPDAVTYLIDSIECYPLRDYLNQQEITDEERRLIGAWAQWSTCDNSLGARPNRASPYDCPAFVPVDARYDAAANPEGVRCSVYDGMRNVFGTRRYPEAIATAAVEFGRSPHDNVGVQYGLEALNAGLITKELFLGVNENIGGWTIDFERTAERTEADPDALRAAYETGRVTSGAGGLASTPVLEDRSYLDQSGNFHTSYYSFVMRSRLIRDNGSADNYVIRRHGPGVSLGMENLDAMDRWLTAIALDTSSIAFAEKAVRARPQDVVDACWDEEGGVIVEPQVFDPERIFDNSEGACNTLYPIHAGPRMVAGGPLTNDVLKCQLQPLDRNSYTVTFTDDEWARMQATFPDGVCDWSRPGVGQVAHSRTWLSFGPSPVNRYDP